MTDFQQWQAEQMQDPNFVTTSQELELAYQIARLRIRHGWTQVQLAEKVGVPGSLIARIENGSQNFRWSILSRIAMVFNASIEIKLIPKCSNES